MALAVSVLLTSAPARALTVDVGSTSLAFRNGTPSNTDIGSEAEVGFTHRYNDVVTIGSDTIDAIVTVLELENIDHDDDQTNGSDGKLDQLDEGDGTDDSGIDLGLDVFGSSCNILSSPPCTGHAVIRVAFVKGGTSDAATLQNVKVTVKDVDSRQFVEYSAVSSYTLTSSPATELTASNPATGTTRFTASSASSSSSDQENWVQVNFAQLSFLDIKLGANESGSAFFGIQFAPAAFTATTSTVNLEAPSYTLTYDNNGSTEVPPSPTTGSGALTVAAAPTRTGYTFTGWNTAANGSGINIAAGASYTPASNVTLYAQWFGALEYLSTTYSGSGTTWSPSVGMGNATLVGSPTYSASAGFRLNDRNSDSISVPDSDITRLSTTRSQTTQLWVRLSSLPTTGSWPLVTKLTAPQWDGFYLSVYADGSLGVITNGTLLQPNTLSSAGVVAAGEWHLITLVAQIAATAQSTKVYVDNTRVIATAHGTDGYNDTGVVSIGGFLGCVGGFRAYRFELDTTQIAAARTAFLASGVTGTCGVSSSTVTFDANGGSGSMSSQTASSATNLTPNAFTRSGFTFAGWNTDANGLGTPYADAASYPFTSSETLHAQWTADVATTVTLMSSTTTTTTTTIPQRDMSAFNVLPSRPFVNSSFELVSSVDSHNFTLQATTARTCRVIGGTVIFVRPGRCTVNVMSGDALMHEFSTRVRYDSPDNPEGVQALASRQVYFGGDSAAIQQPARSKIRRIIGKLRDARAITITGHAADDGDPGNDVARDLSLRRAQAVAALLRARGIEVTVRSAYGKTKPTSPDRADNRRVEIAWYVERS